MKQRLDDMSERRNRKFLEIFPCAVKYLLVEASTEAAKDATSDDVALLATACLSVNQFRNDINRPEVLWTRMQSIGSGVRRHSHYINGKMQRPKSQPATRRRNGSNLLRGFLRKNPGAKTKQREQLN
jgi:hypothetical protein